MKNILLMFLLVHFLIFCDIIDDDNFLSSEKSEEITFLLDKVKKEENLNIDIILVNSKIIVDKTSFFDKKKSVFLILNHANNYVQNIEILVSPDIRISAEDYNKLLESSKNFMRLNHHLNPGSFIIELIDNFKNYKYQDKWSLIYFLKWNTTFFVISLISLILIVLKILVNYRDWKELKFRKN